MTAIHEIQYSSQINGSSKTIDGRRKEDQGVVAVEAVSLQGDLGIIGELEIELEASRLEGLEEQGMGGFDGEVVKQNENAAVGGVVRREGVGQKWEG